MKAPLNRLLILLFTLLYSSIAYANEPVFYNSSDLLKEYIYEGDDIHLGGITNVRWDYNDSLELNKITVRFTKFSSDTSDVKLYTYTVDNFEYKDGYPVSANTYNSFLDKSGTVKYIYDNNFCSIDSDNSIRFGKDWKIEIKMFNDHTIEHYSVIDRNSIERDSFYTKSNYNILNDSIILFERKIDSISIYTEYYKYKKEIKYPLMLLQIGIPDLFDITPGFNLFGGYAKLNAAQNIYELNNNIYTVQHKYVIDNNNRITKLYTVFFYNETWKLTATLKYLHE